MIPQHTNSVDNARWSSIVTRRQMLAFRKQLFFSSSNKLSQPSHSTGAQEYAARNAGLTVSFILVLLIPLALIGLLICRGLLQSRMSAENDLQ